MAVVAPQIGKLRQIVKVEVNERVALGAGWKDNFMPLLNTRGCLRQESGRRVNEQGEAIITKSWVLYTRFQDNLNNNVSKSMRFVVDNRIFAVASYSLVDQKQRYFRFVLNDKE